MQILAICHVPFEGIGCIQQWVDIKGYSINFWETYEYTPVPDLDTFDAIIVMGGPMGVYDEVQYPWLIQEKRLLKAAVMQGKKILGICLGAQLMAEVLGAKVYPNEEKEIGWLSVKKVFSHPYFLGFPEKFRCLHWHGDTFDLPNNAKKIFKSTACENQAYVWNDTVVGFQFHIETTQESLQSLVENCGHEIVKNKPYIQTKELILEDIEEYGADNNTYMYDFLDRFFATSFQE